MSVSGLILVLAVLQTGQPLASAGEESLVWTEHPDPDPGYVPPPVTAEERAAERARKAWEVRKRTPVAQSRQQLEAKYADELRQVEEAFRRTCETIRQAGGGDHPTCNPRR